MFELKPFVQIDTTVKLFAEAHFNNGLLSLQFELHNPHYEIENPFQELHLLASDSNRTHQLWKETCFEMFWSPRNQEKYWELNISSAGLWNIYEFSAYRSPQPPLETKNWLLHSIHSNTTRMQVELFSSIYKSEIFDMNFSAVLKYKNSELSYWSVQHAKMKADFHQRDLFAIQRGIK